MWECERHVLALVFAVDPGPFQGVMSYRDGCMLSWSYSRA